LKKYPTTREKDHSTNVMEKANKIATLKSLIDVWEPMLGENDPYVRKLKRKLREAEVQFEHMRP